MGPVVQLSEYFVIRVHQKNVEKYCQSCEAARNVSFGDTRA